MFADFIQENNVSMIITDYWMPEMTGYELLKKVKVCIYTVSISSQVQPSCNLFLLLPKTASV